MKNKFFLYGFIILLFSCEKEYFPDPHAYRDPRLYATWIWLNQLTNEDIQALQVYTEEGYCGVTCYIQNTGKYQVLEGIWYVEKANENDVHGNNRIHAQARFRNGIWEYTAEYYFMNDTLMWRDIRYDWDTLIKYKYQLIYDGPDYVGLDTLR